MSNSIDQIIKQKFLFHLGRLERLETKLEWISIPFFSKYEVSTNGQVRNFGQRK